MIRYYICPVVGMGMEDDPYRPALVDAAPGLNWSTDIPNRSATDGAPTFGSCVVCVNTSQANHDLIAVLPGVEDALDGLLTTEETRDAVLATLRAESFANRGLARQTAMRVRHAALAATHPTNAASFTQRAANEAGNLEQWMDGLVQQQRRSALVRNLFVSA